MPTNTKGYFIVKSTFLTLVLMFSDIQKLIRLRFGLANSININLRLDLNLKPNLSSKLKLKHES